MSVIQWHFRTSITDRKSWINYVRRNYNSKDMSDTNTSTLIGEKCYLPSVGLVDFNLFKPWMRVTSSL